MRTEYDAIVVGARCAGSPTAMLLARKGYRVLLVDRATFPSDTVSTHVDPRAGIAALQRWGLLDAVTATGCPRCRPTASTSGRFTLRRARRRRSTASPTATPAPHRARQDPGRRRGRGRRRGARATSPWRTCVVEDGRVVGIRGPATGGAAGDASGRGSSSGPTGATRWWRSTVGARAVPRASRRCSAATTPTGATCRSTASRSTIRPDRGSVAFPTNDGLTAGRRRLAVRRGRRRTGRHRGATSSRPLELAARVRRAGPRGAPRVERFHRRRPSRTSSASRTAPAGRWSATPATTRTRSPRRASPTPSATPSCGRARWTTAFSGRRPVRRGAWRATRQARDASVLPIYEFTSQLATLAPPPPETAAASRRRGDGNPGGHVTSSSASSRGRSPRRSSSHRRTSGGSSTPFPQPERGC